MFVQRPQVLSEETLTHLQSIETLEVIISLLRKALLLILAIGVPVVVSAGSEQVVKLRKQSDSVEVRIGGKPFTTYYFGPNSPKPYMAPLRSAQGTVVTRGFPMRIDIPG